MHTPTYDYEKDALIYALDSQKWQKRYEEQMITEMKLSSSLMDMMVAFDCLKEYTKNVPEDMAKTLNKYREEAKETFQLVCKEIPKGPKNDQTSNVSS